MSSEVVVHFEDVSKRYRRGGAGPATLRRELAGWRPGRWGRPRGERRRGPLALDHVSFGVRRGEAYALVGGNGAGKTTALRILSGISRATGGRAWVDGRVAALLEVGAGLHPELSGRENIWLYGTILGLSRRQVRRHFDEIVDFGDLASALDRQVKYYSSGMQLRLGFSIAALLEPDVLIVDEALAVGDLSFQTKCTNRMAAMLQQGTTLLYVSHTLASVRELCTRAALLDGGHLVKEGTPEDIIGTYVAAVTGRAGTAGGGAVEVCGAVVASGSSPGAPRDSIVPGGGLRLAVDFVAPEELGAVRLGLEIADHNGRALLQLGAAGPASLAAGLHRVECHLAALPLLPGSYQVALLLDGLEAGNRGHRYPVGVIAVEGRQPVLGARPRGAVWAEFTLKVDEQVVPC